MSKRLLEGIIEYYEGEEILTADGFDEAVIGIDEGSGRIIYSVGKCIEILMRHDMSEDEAIEYFEFNYLGAYLGESTPIFFTPIEPSEIFENKAWLSDV